MRRMAQRTRNLGLGRVVALIALTALLTACGPRAAPIDPGIGPDGFPLGSFTKDVVDPEFGKIRLAWTFGIDGRWTEVPFALDGQTLPFPAVRGTYTVDRNVVTIATNYPPDWGTARHEWRLDGDRLWTTFVSSDVDGDADWFAVLDISPWTRSR